MSTDPNMMTIYPSLKPANQWMMQHPSSTLQAILLKTQQLNILNQKVLALLEEKLRPFCQVANYTDGHLVLIVSNSAIATTMYCIIPDLLKTFRQEALLKTLRTIRCKVRPTPMPDEHK